MGPSTNRCPDHGHGVGQSGSPHPAENSPAPAYKVFSDRTFLFPTPGCEVRMPAAASDEVRRCHRPAEARPPSGLGGRRRSAGRGVGRRPLGAAARRSYEPRRGGRGARGPWGLGRGGARGGGGGRRGGTERRPPPPRGPSPRGAGELRAGKPRGRATSLARPRARFAGGSELGAFVSATGERRERRPPPQRAL